MPPNRAPSGTGIWTFLSVNPPNDFGKRAESLGLRGRVPLGSIADGAAETTCREHSNNTETFKILLRNPEFSRVLLTENNPEWHLIWNAPSSIATWVGTRLRLCNLLFCNPLRCGFEFDCQHNGQSRASFRKKAPGDLGPRANTPSSCPPRDCV